MSVTEKERKFEKGKVLFQMIYDTTKEKFAILPVLSGITLALVTVGVAGGIFQTTDTIRLIITALLLLTILSLQVYHSVNIGFLDELHKTFAEEFSRERTEFSLTFVQSIVYLFTGRINGKANKERFFNRFYSQFPSYAILILWWVVFMLVYQLWG